jgi:hypothetical protein
VARTYDEQFLLVASLPYAVVGLFSLIHVVRVVRHAQREQDTVLNVFDDDRLFEGEVEHNKRELFAEIGGQRGQPARQLLQQFPTPKRGERPVAQRNERPGGATLHQRA